MKAYLKNHRQAPRKVRLIANKVRGMRVAPALDMLSFMSLKGALPLKKLIESAVANAKVKDASTTPNTLLIQTITVDKGTSFFRYMPRARGRAAPIAKESSHIFVELAVAPENAPENAPEKKSEKQKVKSTKSAVDTKHKAPEKEAVAA